MDAPSGAPCGSLLHVGCGGDPLPPFLAELYTETRVDIDPDQHPDVVASMADMSALPDEAYEAIYCCHALEHLFHHEVSSALSEFKRVLKPGGFALVLVPDLGDVRATEEVLFVSEAGPITGMDLFYGFRKALKENPHMAHKTGFTSDTLSAAFNAVGFAKIEIQRHADYNLSAIGIK